MAGWSRSPITIATTQMTDAATTPKLTRNVDTTDPMLMGSSDPPETSPVAGYGWGTASPSGSTTATPATSAPTVPPPPGPTADPPPPGDAPPPGGRSRRRPVAVVAAFVGSLVLVAAVAGLFIRIPYDSIAPGSARRVDDMISIQDHPAYPPEGRVLLTTVSVRERVNLWGALLGWLDPDVEVIPEKDVRGTLPPEQYHQLNVEAMADSKTSAEAVVLRHLGFTDIGGGAEVMSIEEGLPVDEVIDPNDVVVAADGKPVAGPTDVIGVIRGHQPGDSITLSVVRDGGAPVERTTTLARGDEGQALLGVRLSTKLKLPFGITIDSGSVEGPSAGLPYSIALLDQLTPGELTGGARVAGTGELAADGIVGPIGGIIQKVATVREAKAAMFLVPEQNYAEAKAHAGDDLEVVSVRTFDDALRALATLPGSNAAEFVQSGGPGT